MIRIEVHRTRAWQYEQFIKIFFSCRLFPYNNQITKYEFNSRWIKNYPHHTISVIMRQQMHLHRPITKFMVRLIQINNIDEIPFSIDKWSLIYLAIDHSLLVSYHLIKSLWFWNKYHYLTNSNNHILCYRWKLNYMFGLK